MQCETGRGGGGGGGAGSTTTALNSWSSPTTDDRLSEPLRLILLLDVRLGLRQSDDILHQRRIILHRQAAGTRNVPGVPLVLCPHVQHQRAAATRVQQAVRALARAVRDAQALLVDDGPAVLQPEQQQQRRAPRHVDANAI
jgi:hypothetical protein